MTNWTLLIHGGAGNFTREHVPNDEESDIRSGIQNALLAGGDLLDQNRSALDAVEAAVRVLEDHPHFNAGRGSCYAANGQHEMEAAIMDGVSLRAGAVTGLETIRHPISLARVVLEDGKHIFLSGSGALQLALQQDLEIEDPSFFRTDAATESLRAWQEYEAREAAKTMLGDGNWKSNKFGTVGAVAIDTNGNLAAATSTGGRTNKYPGRIGDTPLIGVGTYADSSCAVSCTGNGEEFMRIVAAHDVSARIQYAGSTLDQAAEAIVFERLPKGSGGIIAVSSDGSFAMPFNCSGMIRGHLLASGETSIALYEE